MKQCEGASTGCLESPAWRSFLGEVMTKRVSSRRAKVAGHQGWKGVSAKGTTCTRDERDEFGGHRQDSMAKDLGGMKGRVETEEPRVGSRNCSNGVWVSWELIKLRVWRLAIHSCEGSPFISKPGSFYFF